MCEGDCFMVEEAASIMGCGRRTVYRLLDEGWLTFGSECAMKV